MSVYALQKGRSGPNFVVAGAFAHPAFLDEGHFERIEGAYPSMQNIRNLLDAVLLVTTMQDR